MPDTPLSDLLRLLKAAGYRFVTPTPATHRQVLRHPGKQRATDLRDVLGYLKMIDEDPGPQTDPPTVCKRSYWMYTQHGGILDVFPNVVDRVRKDEPTTPDEDRQMLETAGVRLIVADATAQAETDAA